MVYVNELLGMDKTKGVFIRINLNIKNMNLMKSEKGKGNFTWNKRKRWLQKRWWYCGRKGPDIKNCGRKDDEKKKMKFV